MDLYIVLGVQREATAGDIKRAYRKLARQWHPDINPGDRAAALRFQQVLEAYETLIDPERRRSYDAGQFTPAVDAPSFGFAGFDFSPAVHAEQRTTFGELFEDVLSRRAGARPGPERGTDIHARASLTFEEAWRGTERAVTVTRQDRCRACAGRGHHQVAETRCVSCEGSGTVRSVRGHMVFSKNCPRCGGTGRRRQTACAECHGQGVMPRVELVRVNVPPGTPDGARVRVAGKGHAGTRGGAAGDLYLEVAVTPHPAFRREGEDVLMVLPLAIHEAGLGTKIEVPTPDGAVRVRVPPGTQSGQRFRLRERGAPAPSGRRGDLIVEVRLTLPRVLDERSKELLREFGRINGESVRD